MNSLLQMHVSSISTGIEYTDIIKRVQCRITHIHKFNMSRQLRQVNLAMKIKYENTIDFRSPLVR
jgi:hypothetical protein